MQSELTITTSKKQELIDITKKVQDIVKNSKLKEGICHVYTQHTTTAIIINENYDPNICLDFLDALNKLVPAGKWLHDKVDHNADAHIKASIVGSSVTAPIKGSQLQLGQWQAIMFCEFDGPRTNRKIILNIL